jgi:hypothetical protein
MLIEDQEIMDDVLQKGLERERKMLIENQGILDDVLQKGLEKEANNFMERTDNYKFHSKLSFTDVNNNSKNERISKSIFQRRSKDVNAKDENSVASCLNAITTCKKCDEQSDNSNDKVGNKCDCGSFCEKQIQSSEKRTEIIEAENKKVPGHNITDNDFWSQWIPSFLQEPEYTLTSLKEKGL